MPPRQRVTELARRGYRRLPVRVRKPIAELRARVARRRVAPIRSRGPLLSVIMPVYNVEGYLEEAVRSVLTQNYRHLELILVDDGSTDTSGEMCDQFATEDPRIRVIHKANAGLGAARNTGISAARGKYLVFIDSDDYVTEGAYREMVESLERTGSDLVTGNVRRKRGSHTHQAWNQSRSHRQDQFRTTLIDTPDLIFDTVAWNKIFRRDFWDANVRKFPENKLYEDMLPIFTAFASANSIDILSRVVYIWRLRDEGNSITQRLLEPQNIDDRFEMVDAIDSMIQDRGMPESLRELLRDKVLEGDLWIYVREMRGAPDEVVERIRRGVSRYWDLASPERQASVHPERRVCYWLLAEDRVADVEPFRQWYSSVHSAFPVNREDGRLLLDPTGCPVSLEGIPAVHLDLDAVAHTVSNVMSLHWTTPTTLSVAGYAYTRFISDGDQQIELVAVHTETEEEIAFPTERTDSPESALWSWDTASRHQHDGYVCRIDVERLRDTAAFTAGRSEWSIRIRVTDGDLVRTRNLSRIWRSGSASVVPAAVLPDGTVATLQTTDGQPLRVNFDRNGVFAESAELRGAATALVTFGVGPVLSAVRAIESRTRREVLGKRTADRTFSFELPLPKATGNSSWWTFKADVAGKRTTVFAPAGFTMDDRATPHGMRTTAGRSGQLAVRCDLGTCFIDKIEVADNGDIEIAGSLSDLDAFEVSLSAKPESWHAATLDGDRFTARIPTVHVTRFGRKTPFAEGNYVIQARHVADPSSGVTVRTVDAVVADFPRTHLRSLLKVRLSRNDRGGIAVGISTPIPTEHLGRPAQTRLINRFVTGQPREVEEAVFFSTDLGSTVGDSALAIAQELARRNSSVPQYWGVSDLSVPVPVGITPIVKLSKDWYDKLNTCRYLINNYGGFWGLRKGPEQRYLQTWHGTPYKYIGASEARHRNAPETRFATIKAEADEWDGVVSASPYMTGIIGSELLYEGRVLETGYPRNDRLATATADDLARQREALQLPQDAKVLLYAPTYRENQRQGWKAELFDALDLDRLLSLLGSDWYVLLRGHSFNARADQIDRSHGRLVDVTHHADVNDLYIAADAMVTDYSSTMFDFAVTGKPMAFFAPDLAQYELARGVYFDLAETVPGPVHSDVAHLGESLGNLDELAATYADKYAAFRERFAPWDDGKAAARVVDAFFG